MKKLFLSFTLILSLDVFAANDPHLDAFILGNNITDTLVRERLTNMVDMLQRYGIYSNVVDILPLKKEFYPNGGSNSFMGRTFTNEGCFFDEWGLRMTNLGAPLDAKITMGLGLDLRTNSLLIVWRQSPDNNGFTNSGVIGRGLALGGLFNLSSYAGVFKTMWCRHYEQVFLRDGLNGQFPNGSFTSNFTNIVNAPNYSYGISQPGNVRYEMVAAAPFIRRTSIMSVSNNIISDWEDGVQARWNTTSYTNVLYSPTNLSTALDTLCLGYDPAYGHTPATLFFGYAGSINCVIVFNKVCDSNMAGAAQAAARCLEPEKYDDLFIGDSIWKEQGWTRGPNSYVGDMAGTPTFSDFFEARGGGYSWLNQAENGYRISNWLQANFFNTYFNLPVAPGVTRRIFFAAGINDIYYDLPPRGARYASATVLFTNFIPPFAALCASNNVKLIVATVQNILKTNTPYTYGDPWTSGLQTDIDSYNSNLLSFANANCGMFSGIVRRDLVVNQFVLDPLNGYSTEGLHFYGMNGFMVQKAIADSFGEIAYNQIFGQPLVTGAMQLSFLGIGKAKYVLERSPNLGSPSWLALATNSAGINGLLTLTNAPDPTTNNFWRIRSMP